jgi:hypothetical protein
MGKARVTGFGVYFWLRQGAGMGSCEDCLAADKGMRRRPGELVARVAVLGAVLPCIFIFLL